MDLTVSSTYFDVFSFDKSLYCNQSTPSSLTSYQIFLGLHAPSFPVICCCYITEHLAGPDREICAVQRSTLEQLQVRIFSNRESEIKSCEELFACYWHDFMHRQLLFFMVSTSKMLF